MCIFIVEWSERSQNYFLDLVLLIVFIFFFFFSSRRRHTRYWRDWSSDVCSSDLHEFGHGLHGLLTKCQYKGTSGTNVVRDFVELPSQITEHWATEPEVLKIYAKHYQSGEVIPDTLIEKILKQQTFNQGFITTELLAAAILDMNLHNLTSTEGIDVVAYEKEAMEQLGL